MKKHLLIKKFYFRLFGKIHNVLSPAGYMNSYLKYLRQIGVKINETPSYISSDVYFDGHNYGQITIEDGVVLSREVMVLTHDYSIARGIKKFGQELNIDISKNTPHFSKAVFIGKNSFIGARASLLPGTNIGENCIIGACSVVKGNIPDNSIVIGNPAKIVGDTKEWTRRHIKNRDYLI